MSPPEMAATGNVAFEPLVDPVVRVIVPARRRVQLRSLPASAEVLRVLASRDLKVKYKQSLLGPLWVFIQPLLLLAAFVVAFKGLGDVKTGNVPYPVFALVGLSAWSYFQAAATICTASMPSNVSVVRYTPCPRVALLASGLVSSLPSFVIPVIAAIIGAGVTGTLSARVLLLPVGLVWLVLLTAGFVAIAASFAVRYRDVLSLLPFLLQLGTFIAPIGYALSGLSPTLRTLVAVNPITGLTEALRWMLLAGYRPEFTDILISLAVTILLLIVGWLTFTAYETTMADEI